MKTYIRTEKIKAKMRRAQKRFLKSHSHPRQGMKHSPETKAKMKAAMERRLADLRKAGLPHFLAGRKIPEKVKKRMRLGHIGTNEGSKNPAWNGGKKHSLGYIYILAPGHPGANSEGYVQEHRLVMEKKLGRFLKPDEIVHHINRIKTDNREENLRLFPSNKAHSSFHRICPHCRKRI